MTQWQIGTTSTTDFVRRVMRGLRAWCKVDVPVCSGSLAQNAHAPASATPPAAWRWFARPVTLALMLHAGTALAQVEPAQELKPAELWGFGDDYRKYPSEQALIEAINTRQAYLFANCKAQATGAYSCQQLTVSGLRSNSAFPGIVNDNYLYFSVDASWYHESRRTENAPVETSVTDASNNYGVDRQLQCPTGFSTRSVAIAENTRTMTCVKYDFPSRSCPKGGGSSASGAPPALGNPIQVTGGIKTETHLDYATADGLLTVRREFLNQFLGWRMPGGLVAADLYASAVAPSPFAEDITVERWNGNVNYTETMTLLFPYMRNTDSKQFRTINPDGSNTVFVLDADGASGTDMNGERVEHLATSTVEGAVWRRIRGDDASEYYDASGLLRKIQLRSGLAVVYRYDSNNRLEEMQDSWGRRILYHHGNDGLLERITLPDGGLLTYAYEEKRLSRVTYPDGSSRRYLYNEEDNVVATSLPPVALTGVIDEKGVRAATYRYDSARRAYSTESAGGVNKYTFSYGSTYTSVTDPLGSVFTFYFSTIQSRKVLSSQNQPAGAGCAAAAARFTYDSNGNVASHTDWNGIKTTYAYDLTRNLETSKTEAAGSATAKTTSTQWHPSYRLPIAIAEPGKLTTFSYDSHGNLLTRSESATSDATGILAFNAVPTGTAQTWRFTYNDVGQVLTRRGPRTDLDDSVSYTYDEQGNLARVTNAAGQTTTFADYDANGRAGTVTDANGLVTALTYTARGRLASHTVEGDTTRYDYDGVGQLTGVSLPDGSSLTYTYDDAHRLTAIADRLGNRLAYTLDQVGNRIDQHASDPNGILARQTSRVYDSLNHLQQLTGGGQ